MERLEHEAKRAIAAVNEGHADHSNGGAQRFAKTLRRRHHRAAQKCRCRGSIRRPYPFEDR